MKYLFFIFLAWRLLTPSVNAGEDIIIFEPRDSVRLSAAVQGTINTIQWSVVSGAPGVTVATPNNTSTMVRGLRQGLYRFRILVFNTQGNFAADTVMVNVMPKNKRLRYTSVVLID